jgi:hypothetical protein
MEIIIRPKKFVGDTHWESKMYGVILVEKEEYIEPLWELLCKQDDYWEDYKNIIKVAPKEIDSVSDISKMCEYAGKTDIYEPKELQAQIPFIMYQKSSENY